MGLLNIGSGGTGLESRSRDRRRDKFNRLGRLHLIYGGLSRSTDCKMIHLHGTEDRMSGGILKSVLFAVLLMSVAQAQTTGPTIPGNTLPPNGAQPGTGTPGDPRADSQRSTESGSPLNDTMGVNPKRQVKRLTKPKMGRPESTIRPYEGTTNPAGETPTDVTQPRHPGGLSGASFINREFKESITFRSSGSSGFRK